MTMASAFPVTVSVTNRGRLRCSIKHIVLEEHDLLQYFTDGAKWSHSSHEAIDNASLPPFRAKVDYYYLTPEQEANMLKRNGLVSVEQFDRSVRLTCSDKDEFEVVGAQPSEAYCSWDRGRDCPTITVTYKDLKVALKSKPSSEGLF